MDKTIQPNIFFVYAQNLNIAYLLMECIEYFTKKWQSPLGFSPKEGSSASKASTPSHIAAPTHITADRSRGSMKSSVP